jgi:hypothetical protein
METKTAHYMLRYHAPLDDFDRHLRRLIPLCQESHICEVMFIIDPEERFFGFPTLDRLREWAPKLRIAGAELRAAGIEMSLNPWVTLGHSERGYPHPKALGFAPMVGDDGSVSPDTACPADPAWQRYIADSYAIFASAGPKILWLEDDHRLHNHPPLRMGCFAKPTLDEFARRIGKQWQREDLVRAIVQNEGGVRGQWMGFTGDLWEENARRIRQAVHAVDPNVELAQMTSSMAAHSAEGRRWQPYLRALCGANHAPITRPHFGPYRDSTGFDFVSGVTMFRHSLAFAGRGTRCCAELDTGPHGYFSLIKAKVRLHMELMAFWGCRDIAANVMSLGGNDPADERWGFECMRDSYPRLSALAAMSLEHRVERGVHVWTHESAALHQDARGLPMSMDSLQPAFDAWANVLGRVGVAYTFEAPSSLTATSGDTIRAADDQEIQRILGGGVLLDGRAAAALQEMGYGEQLGVRVIERVATGGTVAAPLERVVDPRFGLTGSPFMGLAQSARNFGPHAFYSNELRGATSVSEICHGDLRRIAPGLTIFENPLGGRLAVLPFDFDCGMADSVRFYNLPRKIQLLRALRWLNRDRDVLAQIDPTLALVQQHRTPQHELLAIVFLSDDPIQSLRLSMPWPSTPPVESLDADGAWKQFDFISSAENGITSIRFETAPRHWDAMFLRWRTSA